MIQPAYLLLALIIFFMNVFPAFMPPTWTVLAYVYIRFHLFFIPTIVIGAICATLGRIVLYYWAKNYLHVFFSSVSKKNLLIAGEYFNKRKRVTVPLLIAYAFIPIPSNQIYIAAGLAGLDIKLMAASFFVGRLISYSFWVGATNIGQESLNGIFLHQFSKTDAILLDIGGFVLLYILSSIPWQDFFRTHKKK